jgi:hypothetical protein
VERAYTGHCRGAIRNAAAAATPGTKCVQSGRLPARGRSCQGRPKVSTVADFCSPYRGGSVPAGRQAG